MKLLHRAAAILLSAAMLTAFAGCEKEVTAQNLMEGVSQQNASQMDLDKTFCKNYSLFAVRLLQSVYNADEDNAQKNFVISPLAVAHHLSWLYCGESADNRSEIQSLFGSSSNVDNLAIFMHSYEENLRHSDNAELYFENAAWFNADKNVSVNEDFILQNATYFNNAMYKESFGKSAVTNVNNWISNQTRQSIEYIVDELPVDDSMYLMSTVMLDASWAKPFSYQNIAEGTFVNASGEEQTAQMMSGYESMFVHDDQAKGFYKKYAGGNYAFVALLPNSENRPISDYITYLNASSDGPSLFQHKFDYTIDATLPKFSCEYRQGMEEPLTKMEKGLSRFFDADEAKLNKIGSADGGLCAGDLFVRNSFAVTDKGTGKGTAISVTDDNATATGVVTLSYERPFLFMVVDCEYDLPILIGVVNTVA